MRKHRKARLLTMDELLARPCKVDGVPALFHRWVEQDEVLMQVKAFALPEEIARRNEHFRQNGLIAPECSVEVIRKTYALVEYRDGTVHMVAPELVQFTDKEGPTNG